MSAMAGWVAVGADVGVGGTGVLVEGMGVPLRFASGIVIAVDGTGVLVEGMGVAVGGTGELVGATAIAVAAGGTGVAVGAGVPHEAIRSRAKRMEMNGLTDLDMGLLLSYARPMD
jgi:hypothetical protein